MLLLRLNTIKKKKALVENQMSNDEQSYDVMLNVVKGYEGFEDYVESFMKFFPNPDLPITKEKWMEWSRTIDGGQDPENYAEKNWNNA